MKFMLLNHQLDLPSTKHLKVFFERLSFCLGVTGVALRSYLDISERGG